MRSASVVLLLVAAALAQDEEAEIRGVFEAIRKAQENRDPDALLDRFSLPEFMRRMRREGFDPKALKAQVEAVLRRATAMVGAGTVRKIHLGDERKRAVAVVDHRDQSGVVTRARWFLLRTDEGWRLCDMEDLNTAMRLSGTLGVTLTRIGGGDAAFAKAMSDFHRVQRFAVEEEFEGMVRLLEPMVGLPTGYEAVRLFMLAGARLGLEELEECLRCCDKAERLREIPAVALLRSYAYSALEQPETALRHGRRYLELVGSHADGHYAVGIALHMLDRDIEAVAAHRAGLVEDPQSVDNLGCLAVALPDESKSEIGPYFKKLDDPAGSFDELVEYCIEEEDWAALEAFLSVLRQTNPGHTNIAYYEAWLLAEREQYDEAAALLKEALPRVADREERNYFVESYLDAVLNAKRPVAGFKALSAADRAHGFPYLAAGLADEENADALAELLSVQAEKDAAFHLWRAELAWLRKKYGEVVKLLTAHGAAIRGSDDDESWRGDDRLIRSLVRLGEHAGALNEARAVARRDEDEFYLVLAYAAQGEVDQAVAAFERCLEDGYDVEDFYDDEDIGAYLKGDRYKKLRAKHPPAGD